MSNQCSDFIDRNRTIGDTENWADVSFSCQILNHTLATHNQVHSFFENISYNDGKGAFTLTLFEMTITDCPGFHVPHCTFATLHSHNSESAPKLLVKLQFHLLLQLICLRQ
jgi:hypothetical protein